MNDWESLKTSIINASIHNEIELVKKITHEIKKSNNNEITKNLIFYMLTTENRSIISIIKDILRNLEPENVTPLLVEQLQLSYSNGATLLLINILGSWQVKQALEPLLDLANHEDKSIRAAVARAVGLIGDKKAVPALLQMLQTEDFYFRLEDVIYSLGELRDRAAINPLIHTFAMLAKSDDNDDASLRQDILRALDKIESTQLIDSSVMKLFIKSLKDENPGVRTTAAAILGSRAIPQTIPFLVEALDDPEVHVTSEAAEALIEMKDTNHIEALFKQADRHNGLRLLIGEYLAELGDSRGKDLVIRALDDEEPRFFSFVVKALADYGDERVVAPLLQAFEQPEHQQNEPALEQVIRAFDKYGDATTIPFLRQVQATASPHLQELAGVALKHIQQREKVDN